VAAPLPLGAGMDRFSFFFAFYGLILGLGVTELLKGFAGYVRLRSLRKIDPQTALLAFLIFVLIGATWIDAWDSLKRISLDFQGLWAPILLSTAYYLAAAITFPRDSEDLDHLADYYGKRKVFVVALLLAAEFLVNYTYRGVLIETYKSQPDVFWFYQLPYNVVIKLAFITLLLARRKRTNIVALLVLLGLFLVPYWVHGGGIPSWVHAWFGG
jgi:hypothetical protein